MVPDICTTSEHLIDCFFERSSYVGEVGIWTGIWALSIASLRTPYFPKLTWAVAAVSPLVTYMLLRNVCPTLSFSFPAGVLIKHKLATIQVSGVPPLEVSRLSAEMQTSSVVYCAHFHPTGRRNLVTRSTATIPSGKNTRSELSASTNDALVAFLESTPSRAPDQTQLLTYPFHSFSIVEQCPCSGRGAVWIKCLCSWYRVLEV